MTTERFVAAWPNTYLYDGPSPSANRITECLWGDWVSLRTDEQVQGTRVPVHTRGADGWLGTTELMLERPLEVNFVDVGQGDGAFIVTPDDGRILIDAGVSDNMYRFLKWRFNLRPDRDAPLFELAVITHPDEDHYEGFRRLFEDPRFHFTSLRHSGIVERTGADPLGPTFKVGTRKFLTGLVDTHAELRTLLSDPATRGARQYPSLLWTALESGRVASITSARKDDVLVNRTVFGKPLRLTVLSPIRKLQNGAAALPWFSAVGPTKNGHSVVTMLQYGDVKILLGGDLNVPAERYLMTEYGATTTAFSADVAKACHHGSADFTTEFLALINPVATVVSSGDDEPHSHPRADSLGTIGKHSRGPRALIFSTELARSTPDRTIDAERERERILELADAAAAATTDDARARARERLATRLNTVIQRSVEMYGMITLRTDGNRVLLAQRLERERGVTKWDCYPLERDASGTLGYTGDD